MATTITQARIEPFFPFVPDPNSGAFPDPYDEDDFPEVFDMIEAAGQA